MADQSRDALDRFWDDLVRGQPEPQDGLDPRLGNAVRGLHAAEDIEGPSPTFVARLQEDLMLTDTSAVFATFQPTTAIVPNGHVIPLRSRAESPAWTRPSVQPRVSTWLPLGAVVLTLVAGLIALDPDFVLRDRRDVIPAAVFQDATTSPTADAPPPLTSLVLPADVVENWDTVSIGMGVYTIPAGSETAWESEYRSCCPGARVFTVLSGQVAVVVDGEAQVIEPGAEPRLLPTGMSVELATGDTVVTRYEDANRWSNAGDEPTEVLGALMVTGSPPGPDINPGWTVDGADIKGEIALPQGPYALTSVRREIAWDEKIAPPADGAHYLAAAAAGTDGFVSRGPDGGVNAHGAEGTTMTIYLTLVSPAAEGDASITSGIALDQTLVELTLPAEALQREGLTSGVVALNTIAAGSTTTWDPDPNGCCPGTSISFVLEGAATIRAEGLIHVIRAGGVAPPELVAPGSIVTISSGDTLITREEIGWEWTVTGDAPMLILSSSVVSGIGMASPDLASWVSEDLQFTQLDSIPPGPYTLRLRRVTLAPEDSLPGETSILQLSVALPAEDARTAQLGDGAIKNVGPARITIYALTLEPAAPDAAPTIPETAATPIATPAS